MTAPFDAMLRGRATELEHDNGTVSRLPVRRWFAAADHIDEQLVRRCRGATLDIGCGPGRLTQALHGRGLTAIGIDTSAEAVRLTAARGCTALLRSVFDRLPGEGRWRHVVLADGNIGIGGDPAGLLDRVRALLRPGGSAFVEVGSPGIGLRAGQARLPGGTWFPWAEVDADALVRFAVPARFVLTWSARRDDRRFVELTRA